METKFNQPVPKKKRILLRPGWQDRLPIRPVLTAAAILALLTVMILINQPRSKVLNSAEMEMVRNTGVLRIGVDESLYGLYENGEGLETDIGLALGEAIFDDTDGVSFVPCTRYSAQWRMADGYIDLALLSMQSFGSNTGYSHSAVPFYTDDCVLMGYAERPLAGTTVAVLAGTAAETVAYRYVDQKEPEMVVVPCADYYSMLVKLRAGAVDAMCMPRTAALSHLEQRMVIFAEPIGTVSYYAIAPDGSVLLELCSELFTEWSGDGTFDAWKKARGLS